MNDDFKFSMRSDPEPCKFYDISMFTKKHWVLIDGQWEKSVGSSATLPEEDGDECFFKEELSSLQRLRKAIRLSRQMIWRNTNIVRSFIAGKESSMSFEPSTSKAPPNVDQVPTNANGEPESNNANGGEPEDETVQHPPHVDPANDEILKHILC